MMMRAGFFGQISVEQVNLPRRIYDFRKPIHLNKAADLQCATCCHLELFDQFSKADLKRDIKCAFVGGNCKVQIGFASQTKNVMMVAMAVWMLLGVSHLDRCEGIRWAVRLTCRRILSRGNQSHDETRY
jgi:hypothetical protein